MARQIPVAGLEGPAAASRQPDTKTYHLVPPAGGATADRQAEA